LRPLVNNIAYDNIFIVRNEKRFTGYLLGTMMDRVTTIKENPCGYFMAAFGLIQVERLRKLPTNELSCGTQSANISLINRRFSVTLSFLLPDI